MRRVGWVVNYRGQDRLPPTVSLTGFVRPRHQPRPAPLQRRPARRYSRKRLGR
jgi:hypothetical protein